MTTTHDASATRATFEDVLDALFPALAGGLVRLVASNQDELYLRRRRDGWDDATAGLAAPFGWRPTSTTAATFSVRHGSVDVAFSLRLHNALGPGALREPTALWARLVPPRLPVRAPFESEGRVDLVAHAAARQRLTTFAPLPSIILDAEQEILGLWLLEGPLDETRALPLRVGLAHALGGDVRFAHDPAPCAPIPDTRRTGPLPLSVVSVAVFNPARRYPAAAFEKRRSRIAG